MTNHRDTGIDKQALGILFEQKESVAVGRDGGKQGSVFVKHRGGIGGLSRLQGGKGGAFLRFLQAKGFFLCLFGLLGG